MVRVTGRKTVGIQGRLEAWEGEKVLGLQKVGSTQRVEGWGWMDGYREKNLNTIHTLSVTAA